MKKSYNVKINKYFDKTTDTTVLEINVSKELSELLNCYAIRDEKKNTDWSIKELNEYRDEDSNVEYFERFLIKSILKNSMRWSSVLDLMFTKQILDTQKIIVPLNSLRVFSDVQESIESIKQLVKTAEEINRDKEITITLNVDEE